MRTYKTLLTVMAAALFSGAAAAEGGLQPPPPALAQVLSDAATRGGFVGVERSSQFRMSQDRRLGRVGAIARLGHAEEPLSFDEQIALGFRAFHLTVYADPDHGRFARGRASGAIALKQAGLKVVDPEDPDADAPCLTLMTCLMALDAAAAAHPEAGPLVVVIEALTPPPPEPRALHEADRVLDAVFDREEPRAAWERMLLEIDTALPNRRRNPERLILVAAGGEGEPPRDAGLLLDGSGARIFRANEPAVALTSAARGGALMVVIGADWAGEDDPARLSPREAAALGASVVLVAQDAARTDGADAVEIAVEEGSQERRGGPMSLLHAGLSRLRP